MTEAKVGGRAPPTSTYTHRVRNPLADGRRSKSILEATVSTTDWKLRHPEHYEGSVRCSEKKWHKRATEGAMPTMVSQTKAKMARRATDWGSRCSM